MASISKQIGWSQESNLLYQILNQLTKLTSIIFGLKPKYKVYTALLTQSGGNDNYDQFSGDLLIGRTYLIDNNDDDGSDWINVGAPNNNVGTYFVATGTTPNNWGNGTLLYNTGAPVVTVLENTIGNIWFTYVGVGNYEISSNNLFTANKTTKILGAESATNVYDKISIIDEPNSNTSRIVINCLKISDGGFTDDLLISKTIEIRVYS